MARIVVGMAFSLLPSLGQFASAAELARRVVGITDGDTLKLLYEGHQRVRIRLADIGAPESDMAPKSRHEVTPKRHRLLHQGRDEGAHHVAGMDAGGVQPTAWQ